jgi:hypothetical protein
VVFKRWVRASLLEVTWVERVVLGAAIASVVVRQGHRRDGRDGEHVHRRHHGLLLLLLHVQEELRQEENALSEDLDGQPQVGKGLLIGGRGHKRRQVLGRSVENGHLGRGLSQLGQRLNPLDQKHSLARRVRAAQALQLGMHVQKVLNASALQIGPLLDASSRSDALVVEIGRDDGWKRNGRQHQLLHLGMLRALGESAVMAAKELSQNADVVLAGQAGGLRNSSAHGQNDLDTNLVAAVAWTEMLSRQGDILLAPNARAVGNGFAATSLISVVGGRHGAVRMDQKRRSDGNGVAGGFVSLLGWSGFLVVVAVVSSSFFERRRRLKQTSRNGGQTLRQTSDGNGDGLSVLVDMLVAITIVGEAQVARAAGTSFGDAAAARWGSKR